MTATLLLTSDKINGLTVPAEYVAAVREGYGQRDEGVPAEPRTKLFNREPPGMLATYMVVLSETGAMGGCTYPAGFNAEDAWFMTPLFGAQSGEPLALLDGVSMNPFKTGAAGSVAVSALARDGASTLTFIGSGMQVYGQLRTVTAARDLDNVRIYSPTKESRESFVGEMNRTPDASVVAIASSAAAVEGADIAVTATTATDPVFGGDLFDSGTHVIAVDQYHPEKRELDETTIEHATYVPDLRECATVDAGSSLTAVEVGVVDEDHIHVEPGEVVAGVAARREDREEITVFDSDGTGIETVAAAHMLYEKAHEEGFGMTIDFSPTDESLTGQ